MRHSQQRDAGPCGSAPARLRPQRRRLSAWLFLGLMQAATVAAAADPPAVVVVPADADTTSYSTSQRKLSRVLLFQVATPASGAALSVRAEALRGPDERPRALSLGGKTEKFVQADAGLDGQPVAVEIGADLDLAGDYTGRLVVQHGKAPAVVRGLKITRSIPKLPITSPSTLRARSDDVSWRELDLQATLLGPLDQGLTVTPHVADLTLQLTAQSAVQAASAAAVTRFTPATAASGVALRPGVPGTLGLHFKGFDAAGEHRGKLMLSAPDFEPVTLDLVLIVRDPWWLAAGLILIGLGASVVVRRWLGERRPRLVLREQLAALRRHVDELATGDIEPNEAEAALFDGWRRQLEAMDDKLRQAGKLADAETTKMQADLQGLQGKLLAFPAWSAARRQLLALPPDKAKDLLAKVDEIGKDMPGMAPLSDAQQKVLGGLPMEIEKLRGELLQGQLDELDKLAKSMRQVPQPDPALAAQWNRVQDAIGQARGLARQGDHGAARVAQAQARDLMAAAMVADLQARLQLKQPAGVQNWVALKGQVEAALARARQALGKDTEAALAAHAEAYATYLTGLMKALLDETATEAARKPAVDRAAPDRKAAVESAGVDAAKLLQQARAKLEQGDLGGAWEAYRTAFNGWADAQTPNTGFRMGDQEAGQMAIIPGGTVPAAIGAAPRTPRWRAPPALESSEALARQRQRMDTVVDGVAAVAALLLGLNFVWNANPVWGGPIDWALAVLWGLGLHQVTGYSFEGVFGLRDKLAK